MEYINLYIDALIAWIVIYFIGKILFEQNSKHNIVISLIIILVFSFVLGYLNYIDLEKSTGILKILGIYSLFCIFYKIMFKIQFDKSTTASLILYLVMALSEIIVAIITSLLMNIINLPMEVLKNTIIINLIILPLEYIIVYINRVRLKSLVKNNSFSIKSNWLILITILITLALLIYKIPVKEWNFSGDFIVTMIILFCFCIVGIFLIKQKSDIEKTKLMYQQLAETSNITNKVLEEYRMVNHEHKNQLSIIRQMSDNKNKKLIEYLDNLLEKKNDIKYKWVSELNYIPLDGLKGLINYKLIEMEDNKVNLNINISKELEKIKLNKLSNKDIDNLYSIIGIYLDNAKDASIISKEKEVSIEIYKEKKDIVFIIGNSYKGKINLNKIDDYGYSTKGNNHGVGLHIIKKILEENKLFSQERSILDSYFIQKLVIHLDNKKKK